MAEDNVVLRGIGLTKQFRSGDLVVDALRGVDVTFTRGEVVAIIGPSGSGKSTLLGILGGLDTPTEGSLQVEGVDITDMGENRLAEIRNDSIGFVFQQFNLMPNLTALENVALPVQFSRKPKFSPRQRALELLTNFGLADRLRNRPAQLSGGEQQRVAIARASQRPAVNSVRRADRRPGYGERGFGHEYLVPGPTGSQHGRGYRNSRPPYSRTRRTRFGDDRWPFR